MNGLREYSIPFVGLKKGVHEFRFQIKDDFFKNFGNNGITGSDITVDLSLDKTDGFFTLIFSIGGVIDAECDRCLEHFKLELLDEHTIYVKFDDEASKGDEENDVVFISRNATHLEVGQLIYEFINLSIPVQKICPVKPDGEPGCNKKVLSILNKSQAKEIYKKESDPRWAALKNLK